MIQFAPPDVERMILGNKCDLEKAREVERDLGERVSYRTAVINLAGCVCPYVCHFIHHLFLQLAAEHGIKFIETSAKTGQGVEFAFFTLVQDIKDKMELKMVHQSIKQ